MLAIGANLPGLKINIGSWIANVLIFVIPEQLCRGDASSNHEGSTEEDSPQSKRGGAHTAGREGKAAENTPPAGKIYII